MRLLAIKSAAPDLSRECRPVRQLLNEVRFNCYHKYSLFNHYSGINKRAVTFDSRTEGWDKPAGWFHDCGSDNNSCWTFICPLDSDDWVQFARDNGFRVEE